MGPRSRDAAGAARRGADRSTRRSRSPPAARLDRRRRDRARHPDHLRRRARLGALRAGRVRRSASTTHLMRAGADLGVRRRRLLRDRVAAAGEGLPRLRPRADARTTARSRPACCSRCKLGSDVDFLGRAARRGGARPRGRAAGWCPSCVDDPEPMLWGGELVLRDGVAGRPGHQRRVGRDGRRLRRPGLRAPTRPA